MLKDLYNKLSIQRAISPVSVADNTAQVSQIIDRRGYNAVLFAILLGSIADADATFTVLLEHGEVANLSDAAAVPDEELLGTEALAAFQFDGDNTTEKLGYAGNKRYLRLTITPVNNASAAVLAATAILGGASQEPVS